MHAADRHQVSDTAAIENAPVLARHPRLVADCQRDQHRRVAVPAQRAPHAFANLMTGPFDGDPGRGPGLVIEQARLAAHRAGGPQAAREEPRLAIGRLGIERRMRPAQHQRHAPHLSRHHLRQRRRRGPRPFLPARLRRQPRDQDAPGNAGQARPRLLGREAHPARIGVGQFGHAQHQSRHRVLVFVGKRVIQAPLRPHRGIERPGQQPRRQNRQHAPGALAPTAGHPRQQQAGRARNQAQRRARQHRQALHRPGARHHGQAEYAPFDIRLPRNGSA
ncbi:Uncharacterised protein [Achromobacter xylosoxidans]|nr:Uncharacterised protein [Achromobacter xylosoxidans]